MRWLKLIGIAGVVGVVATASVRTYRARRTIVDFGVPEARILRVVGRAATEPLIPEDPAAHANRRLSVVLLRGTNRPEPAAILGP